MILMQHVDSSERRSVKRRRGDEMQTFLITDTGRVRQHNEDCAGVFSNERGDIFAILADGVGGHLAGDVASKMAVDSFEKAWKIANVTTPKEIEQWLSDTVQCINTEIYEYAVG